MSGLTPCVLFTMNLLPYDGQLVLLNKFYPNSQADQYYQILSETLAWETKQLKIFGREFLAPRLTAFYGDTGRKYRYSGNDHIPLPWTRVLLSIKQDIELESNHVFNCVLANLYRTGQDSMGCHADDEKELGINPVIASVSFGESRLFRLYHPASNKKIDLELENGDLLVMSGVMQHHWRHELPKTRKLKHERINLTYRQII
jgi:alkylated DNA repair dioxygenase AlkB